MDIAFFMGLVAGILLGMGFSILFCKHIRRCVYDGMIDAMSSPKKKNRRKDKLSDDDDEANYWKPDDWEPDRP